MEQPTDLKFLSNLNESQLRPVVVSAIKTNNVAVLKEVLSFNKLDFEKDFKLIATNLNNKTVLDFLGVHQQKIKDNFKDILLNKYQTLNPDSYEAKQDLIFYDYFEETRAKIDPQCIFYPNKMRFSKGTYDIDGLRSRFNTITNNIFKNSNWDNMVIAGGFINRLVCLYSSDQVAKSDIDLFIYGNTDEIIKNKCNELFTYLQQFNPIYMMKKSLVHIIIPKLNHIIQIIPKIAKDPIEIINNFDFNYVKMYYDGKNVHATIGALIACKYNLATLDKITKSNVDDRVYKTLQKGYVIQYNPKLKSCSTIVTDHNIDTELFESKNMDVDHEKFMIVQKMLCSLELSKHKDFVKLIFDKDSVVDMKYALNNINISNSYIGEGNVSRQLCINDLTLQECSNIQFYEKSNVKFRLDDCNVCPYIKINLTPNMYTLTSANTLEVTLNDELKGILLSFKRNVIDISYSAYSSMYTHTDNKILINIINPNNTEIKGTILVNINFCLVKHNVYDVQYTLIN